MDTIDNLIAEVTTLCDLKCIHCGYNMIRPHREIDEEFLVYVISQLKQKGLKTIMFTGGEPTLYHSLLQVARYCKQQQLHVKIATNGSNLAQILKLFREDILDELVFSIDAVHPATYKSIRGKNLLHQIILFVEQNSDFANRIHFSFLVQRYNYHELIPFLNQCQSLKIARVSLLVPHFGDDFTSLLDRTIYQEKVFFSRREAEEFQNTIAPQLREFYNNHPQLFSCSSKHIDTLIEYLCFPNISHAFRTGICSFPLKTLFLYSDGNISLCPYHLNWKTDVNSLLNNLKIFRMRCILEGKEKDSYCHHCLEVPL